jgi:hypothetical protein
VAQGPLGLVGLGVDGRSSSSGCEIADAGVVAATAPMAIAKATMAGRNLIKFVLPFDGSWARWSISNRHVGRCCSRLKGASRMFEDG